jgi:4-hydroxybenzoate polyprenyltransferase
MKHTYTEEDVIRALNTGVDGATISRASKSYGVPCSTLQERLKGRHSHQEAAEHLQKLSLVQEKSLTGWILVQESLGLSPTHTQIKDFAQRTLATRGDTTTLGKKRLRAFLKRNPILKTKKQYRIDSARVNGATTDIIKLWFQKLHIPEIKAIKPRNRWNMDEARIMEGQGVNGLVVGSKNRRFIQRKQPGSKAWMSFIECISAEKVALPPLVIIKESQYSNGGFLLALTATGVMRLQRLCIRALYIIYTFYFYHLTRHMFCNLWIYQYFLL